MNEEKGNVLDRRQFIKHMSMAGMGVGLLSALAGCESGDDDDDTGQTDTPTATPTATPTPTPTATPTATPTTTPTATQHSNKSASIGANHGHSATLTAAQQEAGNAVTIELTDGGGHTHTANFSADQVRTIANGGAAASESSVDIGHSHSVTFS